MITTRAVAAVENAPPELQSLRRHDVVSHDAPATSFFRRRLHLSLIIKT